MLCPCSNKHLILWCDTFLSGEFIYVGIFYINSDGFSSSSDGWWCWYRPSSISLSLTRNEMSV